MAVRPRLPGAAAGRVAELEAAGAPRAIRFKVPPASTGVRRCGARADRVRPGEHRGLRLLRSDRYPTYHLSVVVDDVDMAITHVIRGDDHISNTPKHVLLFEALGAPRRAFAHVPLILGADKKRLSKRHGATSVIEYQRQGYLPEAMVNFLALLGWSPGDDRELMSRRELIESFSLEGISGGNAVFNTEKLDWMNGQYIARLPIERARRGGRAVPRRGRAARTGAMADEPWLSSAARSAAAAGEAAHRLRRAGAAVPRGYG